MTKEHAHMIDRKLQDIIDDIHDYYCLLHEQAIRLEPSEYVKIVHTKVLEMAQDLADEFDEEVE